MQPAIDITSPNLSSATRFVAAVNAISECKQQMSINSRNLFAQTLFRNRHHLAL